MCYAKSHNVINFHLKLHMLTNGIILAISGCDTLRPLGIEIRPFTHSVCDTKDHFTWDPKSRVSLMSTSPNMEAKSQLLSLKKPLKYGL